MLGSGPGTLDQVHCASELRAMVLGVAVHYLMSKDLDCLRILRGLVFLKQGQLGAIFRLCFSPAVRS